MYVFGKYRMDFGLDLIGSELTRLHRCWRRLIEMLCVDDNFEMLMTDWRPTLTHQRYHQHDCGRLAV